MSSLKTEVQSNYTIVDRKNDGEPTRAIVEIPDVKTKPPLRVMATIGLENIDVEEILDMCVMSNGRLDYRIKFYYSLLTCDELQAMKHTTRYNIVKEYKKSIQMIDEYEDGEKVNCKRFLIMLQNEWIDYTQLIQHFPNVKPLIEPAKRWASEGGPIVPVRVSYGSGALIPWYPY